MTDPLTLTDRVELRALVDRYGWYADERDRVRFAGLFLDNGTLATPSGQMASGSAGIASMLDQLDARYGRTMHFVGNHVVDGIDADTATGMTYCLAHHLHETDGEARDTMMAIRYHDRYRRTPEGWRFEERILDIHWQEHRPLEVPPRAANP